MVFQIQARYLGHAQQNKNTSFSDPNEYFDREIVPSIEGEFNLKIVKMLLGSKVNDLNHRNKDGDTALILAASRGYIEIVKMLIEEGNASVCIIILGIILLMLINYYDKIQRSVRNQKGRTALMKAVKRGNIQVDIF